MDWHISVTFCRIRHSDSDFFWGKIIRKVVGPHTGARTSSRESVKCQIKSVEKPELQYEEQLSSYFVLYDGNNNNKIKK